MGEDQVAGIGFEDGGKMSFGSQTVPVTPPENSLYTQYKVGLVQQQNFGFFDKADFIDIPSLRKTG